VAIEAARLADDKRGEDIVVLNLTGLSDFCDFFVICSGMSPRHIKGMAKDVEKNFRQAGLTEISSVGWDEPTWILLDFGGVIMHFFMPETRRYYDLGMLWGDGKKVTWRPRKRKTAEKKEN